MNILCDEYFAFLQTMNKYFKKRTGINRSDSIQEQFRVQTESPLQSLLQPLKSLFHVILKNCLLKTLSRTNKKSGKKSKEN